MLRKLLHLLLEKGTMSDSELACELDVSQTLIKQILGELVRYDYLRVLAPGDSTPCERCLLHMTCLIRDRQRVFTITAKGDRIVTEHV